MRNVGRAAGLPDDIITNLNLNQLVEMTLSGNDIVPPPQPQIVEVDRPFRDFTRNWLYTCTQVPFTPPPQSPPQSPKPVIPRITITQCHDTSDANDDSTPVLTLDELLPHKKFVFILREPKPKQKERVKKKPKASPNRK